MDFIGDIIERDTGSDARGPSGSEAVPGVLTAGFPQLYRPEKVSNWRLRFQQKKKNKQSQQQQKDSTGNKQPELTEAEKIHLENVKYISSMSPEQIEHERRELLDTLDPDVLAGLIRRINRGSSNSAAGDLPLFAEVDGAVGTWVGGTREFPNMPRLDDATVEKALGVQAPAVSVLSPNKDFDYDIPPSTHEDEDDIAPQEYQLIKNISQMTNKELLEDVHFVKNTMQAPELDIGDADFMEKLHEKYFPDLPKEVDKLAWMQAIPDSYSKLDRILDDPSECRFDFNGNLVPPGREITDTRTGLHHHSKDEHLAGYTIPELQHLSRSSFASQRCISIQILGRILYKLGKQSYYQLVPTVDANTYEEEGGVDGITSKIYYMFWDLIKSTMIVESLQLAADEKQTKNLNVRNYAIDALWLWKQGGGDPRLKK
ncbi:Rba50p Ecym_1026 [Eremothecium cymbalariae DBVPG|uniref:RNA polymerase II-associated protein RBA50 n=1 Tax=Eremothecium cymbalariae (strain CBS 270.75 / DBVPG 7215 / KCTC 17166 / NRRL Y-17582) TaxID=931890 RepID=G8JM24_ERECY|nr:hypothetical protein Ecym_1026 [Eremothecium cymbalariae DBVPG\